MSTFWQELSRPSAFAGYGRWRWRHAGLQNAASRRLGATQNQLFLLAVGRDEPLVIDNGTLKEVGRVAVQGQPVFAPSRGRTVATSGSITHPKNGVVEVVDAG